MADAVEAQKSAKPAAPRETIVTETPPAPLEQRSKIGRLIHDGTFVTLVEIVPPRGIDCTKELEGAALLASRGIHGINVPDSPRASARMSAQSLCIQIQQKTGIEMVLHYTCRDRNVLSIQSDLLGASSIGLHNILCLTGDPPKLGNYPDATAVFDVDAIGLVNIVQRLNHGLDIGNNSIGASTNFTIGIAAGILVKSELIWPPAVSVSAGPRALDRSSRAYAWWSEPTGSSWRSNPRSRLSWR